MQCHHFDAGRCRSCTLLPIPHADQVRAARGRLADLLAPFGDAATEWGEPIVSAESGFRAKAKMVVSGTAQGPVLGLLPPAPGEAGVDLVDCPLYPSSMESVLESVRALITRAQIPPYDVARRRGELKYVLATVSPDDEYLLRFVLRSEGPLDRLREHLPQLLQAHPSVRVVSANIHPEHKAVVEGPQEIHLAGEESLPMRTGAVTLRARPQSFLQTNTAVAGQLYLQVKDWVEHIAATHADNDSPMRIWDLYCGVGGFALHAASAADTPAARRREVIGVEVSAQAVEAAREAAEAEGLLAQFYADDASAWAERTAAESGPPDLLIVNPPRRGIGERLSGWIEDSGMPYVIYSSCNPVTLAADLARMPSYRLARVRYVDMFPHTRHAEVLTVLERRGD